MHKVTKTIIQLVAGIFGSLAIIFGVAAWRLSSGPVSIGFLSPYIAEAFEDKDLSYRLKFDDTVLTWAGWNRSLDILVTDANVIGVDGEILASVPKISLGLSALSLLRGKIEPTSIELLSPEIHLVRNVKGELEFGFGPDSEDPDDAVNNLIADFLSAPGTDHALGQLGRISVLSASLDVDDAMLGLSWSTPAADLIFDLYDDHINGELLADIEVADIAMRIVATTEYDRASQKTHTNVEFGKIVPSQLAEIFPRLEALSGFNIPISGGVEFTLGPDGTLTDSFLFDLTGGAGSLSLPKIFPAPPNITALRMRGEADVKLDALKFDEFFADTGGPIFSFDGFISGVPDQTAIQGTFEFQNMPFDDLKNYWPDTFLVSARNWFLGNVFDGVVEKFTAQLDVRPGELNSLESGLRPSILELDFIFHDATVNYFPGQRYAYGLDGAGSGDGTSISMNLYDATIAEMYAPSGVALITGMLQDSALLTIIANIEGPAANVINILDGPRLGYPRKMGFKSEQFSGQVTAEMGVQLPFRSDVSFEEVQFAAVARMDNLAVTSLIGGYDLRDGQMRLALDKNSMDVSGTITLAGIPADVKWTENFSSETTLRSRYDITAQVNSEAQKTFGISLEPYARGPFGMNLTYTISVDGTQQVAAALDAENVHMEVPELFWKKPVGEGASILVLAKLEEHKNIEITNFQLNAKDLRLKGRAEIEPEQGQIINASLSRIQLGDNDVAVTYRRNAENNMVLNISGKSLDLRPYIAQLQDSDEGGLPPFILEANVERLITRSDQQITDARARVVNTTERLESAFLSGTLISGSELRLVLEPDGAKRRLVVRSDDAGSVARAFNIYDDVLGGSLVLDATLHDDEQGTPVIGNVLIKDYRVLNAPTLAKILAIASFTGIFEALQGDGIAFSTFYLPFSLVDGIVTVQGAQTAGLSIGVNASGKVNLENDKIDIRGTIVPAYAINSLLGNIPVIGDLLVGGKGEGIFAATFSVKGTVEEPTVLVNPLAALAPGFLRKLFSVFDEESDVSDEAGRPKPDVPSLEENR